MKIWLVQHQQASHLVLSRLLKNKLSTFYICLSIGVTLSLPSVGYIILDNLTDLASNVKRESKLSVFLSNGLNKEVISNIEDTLKQNPAIHSVTFVSKKDALEQLTAVDSQQSIMESLGENPLPDAFFVEPKVLDIASLEALKTELTQIKGVEIVVLDETWIKRLNHFLSLGLKILLILAALLGFALISVISNTIRMQILTQQAEIELSQLIGATKSFIHRPFLYIGAFYGLAGGALSIFISCITVFLLNQTIKQISYSYQTSFMIEYPKWYAFVALLIISSFIGLISAYSSVSFTPPKQTPP